MKYLVRKSFIDVVGKIWMPAITASLHIRLSDYDINNMRADNGKITRESVENWLGTHTGDFQSVQDFSASIEDGEATIDIPWASEDGEIAYCDTVAESE